MLSTKPGAGFQEVVDESYPLLRSHNRTYAQRCKYCGLKLKANQAVYCTIRCRTKDAIQAAPVPQKPPKSVNTHQLPHLGRGLREAIIEASSGLCCICGSTRGKRNHHIDHCHATGVLRGLLCHNCNLGIGHFKDNIELLEKAITYLRFHQQ
jgi:hypothetical protein